MHCCGSPVRTSMADAQAQSPPSERRRRGMREGFAAGACATAASLGGTRAVIHQQPVEAVTIHLPLGRDATFALARCELSLQQARCGVIKDAGDDPDATHGAEIISTVAWRDEPGLNLIGGSGVGVVTRPGLGLDVGGPAINPGPRRMITENGTAETGDLLDTRGLATDVSRPRG